MCPTRVGGSRVESYAAHTIRASTTNSSSIEVSVARIAVAVYSNSSTKAAAGGGAREVERWFIVGT